MKQGVWRKGDFVRKGHWEYVRHCDRFIIWLDKPVSYGGVVSRKLTLQGYDTPEWNGWRLDR